MYLKQFFLNNQLEDYMSVAILPSSVSNSSSKDQYLSQSLRVAIHGAVGLLKNNLENRMKPEKVTVIGLLPPDIDHEQLELGLDYFHTQVSNLFNEKIAITGEFVNGTNWLHRRMMQERPNITEAKINKGLIIPIQMSSLKSGQGPRIINYPELVHYFKHHHSN
jgi:hypothetical protein